MIRPKRRDPMLDDSLLTFDDVIRYLKVSRSTVYRLIWRGELKGHKVGSSWRFYRDDVKATVQEEGNDRPA